MATEPVVLEQDPEQVGGAGGSVRSLVRMRQFLQAL